MRTWRGVVSWRAQTRLTIAVLLAALAAWALLGSISSAQAWTNGNTSGGVGAVGEGTLPEGFRPSCIGIAPGAIEAPVIPGGEFKASTGVPYAAPPGIFGFEPIVNVDEFTATANWGDGMTTPASVTQGGPCEYEVNAPSHIYANPGTYPFSYTVHEIHTGQDDTVGAEQLYVWSVPQPVESRPPRTITATVGRAWSGVVGEFAYDAAQVPLATYSVQINWGDDSAFSTGTLAAQPNGHFTVTGTHTYSAPATGTIKLTMFGNPGPELGDWATASFIATTQLELAHRSVSPRLHLVGHPILAAIPRAAGGTAYELIFRLNRPLPRSGSGQIEANLKTHGSAGTLAGFGRHASRACYTAGIEGLTKRSARARGRFPFTLSVAQPADELAGRASLHRYFNFVAMLTGANRRLGC